MMDDDMPPGIPLAPGGGPIAGGGAPDYIPPPPGAQYEQGGFNPFPGASQANWAPPLTAPVWPTQPQPWNTSNWPRSRYGYPPHSPYTPAASWGGFTPASHGLPTPGGATQELTVGQPITSSYFNGGAGAGAGHSQWPADAGPERKPNFYAPLERAHSQEPMYAYPHSPGWAPMGFGAPAGYQLVRSLSAGPGAGRPVSRNRGSAWRYYARDLGPEEYDSDNLARRPKDWRPDYVPLRTFNIPRIQRPRSDVEEYKDPIKRTMHSTLSFTPTPIFGPTFSPSPVRPPVTYDLRFPPHPDTIFFQSLQRPCNQLDFAQLATTPPVHRLRLFHPLLPWYIDVEQRHENGVTVGDVFMQMYWQLQLPITARHYFNEDLGSKIRERIAQAYGVRTQGSEEEKGRGVKRVDFLEGNVVFVGLVRSSNGLWEMKTDMKTTT